jgi:hypothetical protein
MERRDESFLYLPYRFEIMFPIEQLRFAQKLFFLQRKLECSYYGFRKNYQNKLLKFLKISDILLLCTYLLSAILDAAITLHNIQGPGDESHPFTSFMMQEYGVQEGLLRVQGIEVLQLAVLLGFAHIVAGAWTLLKGEAIDVEVRFGLVYIYLAIGIGKHVQGILSWL